MSFATFRAACRRSPVAIRQWLPGQREFRSALEKAVIWFGFNGCGKTAGLVGRLIDVFEGTDPIVAGIHRPIKIVLCVTGYEAQSAIDFADQLHALCPQGLVAQQDLDEDGNPKGRPAPWYARGKGFRGRPPRLIVQRGPLKGSTLNVTTLGSGAAASAGGTIDLIIINEPVSREVFEELSSRDRAGALGYLWYAFTPILDADDQTWIPSMVRDVKETGGSIRYIQTELTEAALVFPSSRRLEPWSKTLARVAKWSPETREMRSGRSLEPILEGTFFSSVWGSHLLSDDLSHFAGSWTVAALDWSTRDGRNRFVLTAWTVDDLPVRHLVGFVVGDIRFDSPDPEKVAAVLVAYLDNIGIPVESIDEWIGDRAAVADRGMIYRDNVGFLNAMRAELKKRGKKTPKALVDIITPRKKGGSSWFLMGQIRNMFSATYLHLMTRCTELQSDIQRWDMSRNHPAKDGLDALGYAYQRAAHKFNLWQKRDE